MSSPGDIDAASKSTDAPIRHSIWRPRGPVGAAARRSLRLRRLFVGLLLFVLVAVFYRFLTAPFEHPQLWFAALTTISPSGDDHAPADVVPFITRDLEAWKSLAAELSPGHDSHPLLESTRPFKSAELEALGRKVGELSIGERDVLLLYIHTQGGVRNGEPVLWCSSSTDGGVREAYPLARLLSQLRTPGHTTKVLILDAGRNDADWDNGIAINEFPRLVADAVAKTGDPHLWVLVSHGILESSQVSWSRQRGVLTESLIAGLSEKADADGDDVVDLSEWFRYTAGAVAQATIQLSNGQATQTPQLLWGQGELPADFVAPVIAPVAHKLELPPTAQSGKQPQDASPQPAPARNPFRGITATAPAAATPSVAISATPGGVTVQTAPPAVPPLPAATAPSAQTATSALQSAVSNIAEKPAQSQPPSQPQTASSSPAAAPAGTPAPPASEAKPEADSPAATDAPSSDDDPIKAEIARLLVQAWELRDRLQQRRAGTLTPVDTDPSGWRRLINNLLALEFRYRSDALTDVESTADDLRQIVEALAGLADHQPQSTHRDRHAELWKRLEANSTLPSLPVPSVALATALAERGGPALPSDVLTAVQQLEGVLQSPDRSAFDLWLTGLAPELSGWPEIDVARELAVIPDVDWELLRDAISIRIDGERAAASWETAPMVRTPATTGDELRLAAEQMLLDGVLAGRTARAAVLLKQARQHYSNSRANSVLLRQARELWHDLSFQAPDYVQWCAETGLATYHCGPTRDDVKRLLESLQELGRRLQSGQPDDRDAILIESERLERIIERIGAAKCTRHLTTPRATAPVRETPWQIQSLLATSLPTGEHRLHLLQQVTSLESSRLDAAPLTLRTAPVPPRTMSPRDWDYLFTCSDLHLDLARLAVVGLPSAASLLTDLERQCDHAHAQQVRLLDECTSRTNDELFHVYRELGTEFAGFYQKLAVQLEQTAAGMHPGSDPGDIDTLLSQYNGILQARRLTTAHVRSGAQPHQPLLKLQAAGLLTSAANRARSAASNADRVRVSRFQQRALQLQRASDGLLDRDRIVLETPAGLTISTPSSAELMQPEQTIDVSVTAEHIDDGRVWIVLEYDPELIRVDGPAGLALYQEFELSRHYALGVSTDFDAAAKPATSRQSADSLRGLPLPEADGTFCGSWWTSHVANYLLPTWTLSNREPMTFSLRVRRLQPATRPVRLVVKALTQRRFARNSVQFHTPAPAFVDLQVEGRVGASQRDERGIVLHPFPNNDTEYRLRLVNLQQASRVVDVRLLALPAPLDFEIPFATLSPAESQEMFDRLRSAALAGKLDQRPLPVPGALTADDAAQAEPPEDPEAAAKKPLPTLRHGGVVAIVDRNTQEAVFVPVRIEPQRPARYLRPTVGYDLERERVEIVVRGESPDVMPSTGSSVRAEFSEPLDDTATFQLDGVLQAPGFETRLFADVPAQPGKVAHLKLHVDGYPRAFLYAIPCDRDSTAVPLTVDALAVAVHAPPHGSAVRTPADGIPVALELDAPVGAFDSLPTIAEVGLDLNRDRFLVNEPSVRLPSDREVDVHVKAFQADGTLTLQTRISDFQIMVPAAGLSTVTSNVLARIQVDDRVAWSEPRETTLDGDPPRILHVELHPGRDLSSEQKLRVVVRADDRSQSGTAAVELTFDMLRTGEFAPDAKIIPAGAAEGGAWVAEVPLADLTPGTYGLLIRAVDGVGNRSDVHREIVTILSAEAAAARLLRATAPVEGVALYGEAPVSGATILLEDDKQQVVAEGRSNAEGRFELPRVKPGPYKVKAQGLVKNKVRVAEAEVAVPEPPMSAESVRLQLR